MSLALNIFCKYNNCNFKNNCLLYFTFNKSFRKYCNKINTDDTEHIKSFNIKKIEDIPSKNIRNFSIIAHVDHGKSTLADRILEIGGLLNKSSENKQVLDRLQVERERGITVKAQTASLIYSYNDQEYLLNLIDTPGHVDFSNEVSRSLAACQGVILLVDANQGIQAQTVANFYLSFAQDLVIIPVLNKVDLKNANPEGVKVQLQNMFEINPNDVLKISAKFGTNVDDVLKAVINRIPPPNGDKTASLQCLLIDSWHDRYRGAVGLIYVKNGIIKIGDNVQWYHTGLKYTVKTLSILQPTENPVNSLAAGQVGAVTCSMKNPQVGDTLIKSGSDTKPLTKFSPAQPMVFAGVYPMDQSEHPSLRNAIEKLTLNDNAVTVVIDSSPALGQGWRLGFLGLLHLEVFSQRLEQEFGAHSILSAPSVTYKIKVHGKKLINIHGSDEIFISNPINFPDVQNILEIQEPIVLGTIITPDIYWGDIIALCTERRGVQQSAVNIDDKRLMVTYLLPLSEIVIDFHDKLKSLTSGFASFDYEDRGYAPSNLIKMDILLNGKEVEELSLIVHQSKTVQMGKKMCNKLLNIIPRQQFSIAIQAKVGGKIVARENLKPYRKDVTAKLYGGDVTRRMKLLKRQSEGKQRLKMVANIALPRETFIEVLKT